jgi:hypothetical protein
MHIRPAAWGLRNLRDLNRTIIESYLKAEIIILIIGMVAGKFAEAALLLIPT